MPRYWNSSFSFSFCFRKNFSRYSFLRPCSDSSCCFFSFYFSSFSSSSLSLCCLSCSFFSSISFFLCNYFLLSFSSCSSFYFLLAAASSCIFFARCSSNSIFARFNLYWRRCYFSSSSLLVSSFSLTDCGSFYCVLFRRMSTALSTWRGLNFDSIFLMRIFSIVSAHLSIGPVPNIVLSRSSTTSMHTLYGSGRSTLTVDRSSMTVSVTFL